MFQGPQAKLQFYVDCCSFREFFLFKIWSLDLIGRNLCSDKSMSIGHNSNVSNAELSNFINADISGVGGFMWWGPTVYCSEYQYWYMWAKFYYGPWRHFTAVAIKCLGTKAEGWLLQNIINSFRDWRSVIIVKRRILVKTWATVEAAHTLRMQSGGSHDLPSRLGETVLIYCLGVVLYRTRMYRPRL
jgi:hypothetical protein